mmetsp:Transcript_14282/g.35627  ORF Transcript_14282/g.35627 Transcript_14282/m.35627 type:complete len:231 (-) Transcript_14282:62-754(-)
MGSDSSQESTSSREAAFTTWQFPATYGIGLISSCGADSAESSAALSAASSSSSVIGSPYSSSMLNVSARSMYCAKHSPMSVVAFTELSHAKYAACRSSDGIIPCWYSERQRKIGRSSTTSGISEGTGGPGNGSNSSSIPREVVIGSTSLSWYRSALSSSLRSSSTGFFLASIEHDREHRPTCVRAAAVGGLCATPTRGLGKGLGVKAALESAIHAEQKNKKVDERCVRMV